MYSPLSSPPMSCYPSCPPIQVFLLPTSSRFLHLLTLNYDTPQLVYFMVVVRLLPPDPQIDGSSTSPNAGAAAPRYPETPTCPIPPTSPAPTRSPTLSVSYTHFTYPTINTYSASVQPNAVEAFPVSYTYPLWFGKANSLLSLSVGQKSSGGRRMGKSHMERWSLPQGWATWVSSALVQTPNWLSFKGTQTAMIHIKGAPVHAVLQLPYVRMSKCSSACINCELSGWTPCKKKISSIYARVHVILNNGKPPKSTCAPQVE